MKKTKKKKEKKKKKRETVLTYRLAVRLQRKILHGGDNSIFFVLHIWKQFLSDIEEVKLNSC